MRKLLLLTSKPIDDAVDMLRRNDWNVYTAGNTHEARLLIGRHEFRVGIVCYWPQDSDQQITELNETVSTFRRIKWLATLPPEFMDRESCVALAAEYLFDFLSLPLDTERLAVIIGHAGGMADIEDRYQQQQERVVTGQYGMIGSSPPMRTLYRDIERAANSEVPVVISGETGTGKEMSARAIHSNAACASGPFVTVNCAAVPASLIQAELYGYEKGAFTDAFERKIGYLETANGGTLFLDEIGELSPEAQASLLRFLENGQVTRLGGSEPVKVSVRVVCATNADLKREVADNRFRLDLYYRLHVLSIRTPSLRERGEDVEALAQHFLDEFLKANVSSVRGFSRDALSVMNHYEWPGNLRELRNRIHQAALYATNTYLTPADLDLERRTAQRSIKSLQEARDLAERSAILSALKRNSHNVSKAAKELRVSRMTLYRLMQKHGMS